MAKILHYLNEPRDMGLQKSLLATWTLSILFAVAAVVVPTHVGTGVLFIIAVVLGLYVPLYWLLISQGRLNQESRELWGLQGIQANGAPLPAPGGWALGAAPLNLLIREARRRNLSTVVELGPGASSIIMGLTHRFRLSGVEHDPDFARILREQLLVHGIDYDLIESRLASRSIGTKTVEWYGQDALMGLPSEIDVLVVDGPPNWRGDGNRWPAWPSLRDRMNPGSLVLVDDTHRWDEREMVRDWIEGGGLDLVFDGGDFMLLSVQDIA